MSTKPLWRRLIFPVLLLLVAAAGFGACLAPAITAIIRLIHMH